VNPPVALTVAGSDSGGGAGLQADLKAFAAHRVFGTSVVTAVTAQNTAAVLGVTALDVAFVDLQLTAVLDDLPVAAVKTGMLATGAVVELVADWAAAGRLPHLVVDPVLVSSTGHRLLDDSGPRAYLDRLLPHAEVATPNRREAALLADMAIDDVDDMVTAAHRLAATGARLVVVKGGHLTGGQAPDVVVAGGDVTVLDGPRVPTANDHGTGCTLSASIAAELATGVAPLEAVRRAKQFVTEAIRGAAGWRLGAGHGPLDPLGWGREAG